MSKEQLEAMRRAVRAARFVPIDYEALKKIQPTPLPKKKFVYDSNFRYPSGNYEDDDFFYFVQNEGFFAILFLYYNTKNDDERYCC